MTRPVALPNGPLTRAMYAVKRQTSALRGGPKAAVIKAITQAANQADTPERSAHLDEAARAYIAAVMGGNTATAVRDAKIAEVIQLLGWGRKNCAPLQLGLTIFKPYITLDHHKVLTSALATRLIRDIPVSAPALPSEIDFLANYGVTSEPETQNQMKRLVEVSKCTRERPQISQADYYNALFSNAEGCPTLDATESKLVVKALRAEPNLNSPALKTVLAEAARKNPTVATSIIRQLSLLPGKSKDVLIFKALCHGRPDLDGIVLLLSKKKGAEALLRLSAEDTPSTPRPDFVREGLSANLIELHKERRNVFTDAQARDLGKEFSFCWHWVHAFRASRAQLQIFCDAYGHAILPDTMVTCLPLLMNGLRSSQEQQSDLLVIHDRSENLFRLVPTDRPSGGCYQQKQIQPEKLAAYLRWLSRPTHGVGGYVLQEFRHLTIDATGRYQVLSQEIPWTDTRGKTYTVLALNAYEESLAVAQHGWNLSACVAGEGKEILIGELVAGRTITQETMRQPYVGFVPPSDKAGQSHHNFVQQGDSIYWIQTTVGAEADDATEADVDLRAASFANNETFGGTPVTRIVPERLFVSEDNHAFDVVELVTNILDNAAADGEATYSSQRAFNNPFTRQFLSDQDLQNLKNHPHPVISALRGLISEREAPITITSDERENLVWRMSQMPKQGHVWHGPQETYVFQRNIARVGQYAESQVPAANLDARLRSFALSFENLDRRRVAPNVVGISAKRLNDDVVYDIITQEVPVEAGGKSYEFVTTTDLRKTLQDLSRAGQAIVAWTPVPPVDSGSQPATTASEYVLVIEPQHEKNVEHRVMQLLERSYEELQRYTSDGWTLTGIHETSAMAPRVIMTRINDMDASTSLP